MPIPTARELRMLCTSTCRTSSLYLRIQTIQTKHVLFVWTACNSNGVILYIRIESTLLSAKRCHSANCRKRSFHNTTRLYGYAGLLKTKPNKSKAKTRKKKQQLAVPHASTKTASQTFPSLSCSFLVDACRNLFIRPPTNA